MSTLAPHHYAMLHDESGISDEVITERGYCTAERTQHLAEHGFPGRRPVPALLLPVWNVHGAIAFYQMRADTPRRDTAGKVVGKYLTPSKGQMVLDVHPLSRPSLGNPHVPLVITEGIKKADSLTSRVVCTIGLLGVWNWRGTNDQGGKVALSCWESVALNGRQVFVVYDSDVMEKPDVADALTRLKAFLEGKKAKVSVIYLPAGASGAKCGVDDYLVQGHTLDELFDLATTTLRPVAGAPGKDLVGAYEATRAGLVWWKKSPDDEQVAVPLTNFTARIIADVVEDDGADTRRSFEIEACHEGRTVRFPVDASHFAGMTWAMEHLGARAAVYPGVMRKDHARMAVQMFSQTVHARHVYTHLGWRKIAGSWCYLHAAGAIGAAGPVAEVEVAARHTLAAYVLPDAPPHETHSAALRASLHCLDTAADAVTLPLYAALWRAVLGQTDFSLHLVGPTGAGKSELAALIQQHYGADMTARRLPAAWTSTGNALEALAFEAKDVVLVVDDFCPSGSHADIARFHRDADRLLRAQGNHSARQRMRPDGSLRAVKPPRGLIVSTGEDTPQGQSLRARILILDVPKACVNWSTLTACQQDAADGTYAAALAGFVQWLAPHYEEVARGLHAEIATLRQAALTRGHRRTPELIGNLALGIQYVLAYGYDCGAWTAEECAALWERTWTALVHAADAQSEHHANEEPVRRFFALLTGALTTGLAHIADASTLAEPSMHPHEWGWRGKEIRKGEDVQMFWEPLGPCVGWLANERLYLEGEVAFSVVQKLAESQKAPLAITQQTLWKRMHEQKLLARLDTQRSNKAERTVGGKRYHVVDISSALLPRESDASDASDAKGHDPQQNQAKTLRHFPAWYRKSDAIAETEVTQSPGAPRSSHAFGGPCVTSTYEAASLPFQEVTHIDNPHPQQNQGGFHENNDNASLASLASLFLLESPSTFSDEAPSISKGANGAVHPPAPCSLCASQQVWYGAQGQPICQTCHPQPGGRIG